jgi:hypothetical protein
MTTKRLYHRIYSLYSKFNDYIYIIAIKSKLYIESRLLQSTYSTVICLGYLIKFL